jgi:hypothetical protein
MKTYNLSRGDMRRLQNDDGSLAEETAAAAYSAFERDFKDADTHDLVTSGDGWVEVKSAFRELENGNRGRFRLWESQHSALVRKDRRGTAWYVFVLWDVDNGTGYLTRQKPADIGRTLRGRGGWNRSGHASMGKQHKLPWALLFDL